MDGKPKPPLKAIFFDIDDTLYPTTALTAEARVNSVNAMIKYGLNLPFDHVWRELDEIIAEFSSNYSEHFNKLLMRLPRGSYKNVNPAVVIAAGVTAYHDVKIKKLHAFEDVIEVLRILSKTPLILGVISAGLDIKQAEKLVRLNVLPYLTSRAVYISDQIGISKPNPKLYLRVCSDLNLSPAACMYVGDHPLHDVDPANEIGMITVQSMRSGKYTQLQGKTRPRHEISNFWDLLDILRRDFGFSFQE